MDKIIIKKGININLLNNKEIIFSKSKGFSTVDINPVELQKDEVLVKVRSVGLCGSDLFHYINYKGENLRLGHEWFGEIAEIGSEVKNIKIGDIVTTSSTLGCGKCIECQNQRVNFCQSPIHLTSEKLGALRDNMVINSFNIITLKSNHDSEVLIELFAVGEEAIRLSKIQNKTKSSILILGCGPVGLAIAHCLTSLNLEFKMIDQTPFRVLMAHQFGFQATVLSESLLNPIYTKKFDTIFDATTDRKQFKGGFNFITIFGKIGCEVLVISKYIEDIKINSNLFSQNNFQLNWMKGVPLSTLKHTVEKWSGKLEKPYQTLVTDVFNTNDIENALHKALDGTDSGKIVIKIN